MGDKKEQHPQGRGFQGSSVRGSGGLGGRGREGPLGPLGWAREGRVRLEEGVHGLAGRGPLRVVRRLEDPLRVLQEHVPRPAGRTNAVRWAWSPLGCKKLTTNLTAQMPTRMIPSPPPRPPWLCDRANTRKMPGGGVASEQAGWRRLDPPPRPPVPPPPVWPKAEGWQYRGGGGKRSGSDLSPPGRDPGRSSPIRHPSEIPPPPLPSKTPLLGECKKYSFRHQMFLLPEGNNPTTPYVPQSRRSATRSEPSKHSVFAP